MPKDNPSPDALAIAAEWWRVEEMGAYTFGGLFLNSNMTWGASYRLTRHWTFVKATTPAAAIIAAHEAWQKEHK
jgi:hypothetical protein